MSNIDTTSIVLNSRKRTGNYSNSSNKRRWTPDAKPDGNDGGTTSPSFVTQPTNHPITDEIQATTPLSDSIASHRNLKTESTAIKLSNDVVVRKQHQDRQRSPQGHRQQSTTEQKSREQIEVERQHRMALIRAENEYEEAKIDSRSSNYNGGNTNRHLSNADNKNGSEQIIQVNFDDTNVEEVDEEEQMQRLFGISGFSSTKNTKVSSNHNSSALGIVAKHKARKYRQYMNRKNGFNRPLDNV
jgi:U4/U6.U5 tri-snRNP-associated protein 3